MGRMSWSDEWWRRLSGPQRMIEEAVEIFQTNGVVLLRVPDDLCWRQTFRAVLEEQARGRSEGELFFEELDVRDECPDVADETAAGLAVLHKFLGPDSSGGYRPRSGSIARFLSGDGSGDGSDLFRDRALWVKGIHTPGACRAFCDLCAHCQRGKVRIVLEDHTGSGRESANLRAVDHDRFISSFDVQLLCMMAVNEDGGGRYGGLSLLWRQYIAVLSAELCGPDAELAAVLLEEHDLRTEDPLDALRALAGSGRFDRRGARGHVLRVLRTDPARGEDLVRRRIWRAQLKTGLPVLEQAWTDALRALRPAIACAMGDGPVYQYGAVLTDPDDLEAGTAVYLMAVERLSVPDPALRARIHCIHENRNRMAHVTVCTNEQMDQVFALAGPSRG